MTWFFNAEIFVRLEFRTSKFVRISDTLNYLVLISRIFFFSELIVTIRSASDGKVITDSISIVATNIDTMVAQTFPLTGSHLGILKISNPTLVCEGSNLRLEVAGSSPGFVGSQIFYRIDKLFEEVDFFVSTVWFEKQII